MTDPSERRLDGGAAAGTLADLFALDLSTARIDCLHCRGSALLGEHTLYPDAPALVLRCPDCTGVVLRFSSLGGRVRLDLTGTRLLTVDLP